jgi:hypothetical protein
MVVGQRSACAALSAAAKSNNGCTAGLPGSGHAAILGSRFSIEIIRRPTQDWC